MQLFLCEKPSQARDIARVLGVTQKAEGWLRGPIAPICPRTSSPGGIWRSAQSRVGASVMRGAEFPVGHCCRHRPVTPRAPASDRRPDGLSVPVRAPPSRWPRSGTTARKRRDWRNRARATRSCNSLRRRARVSVNTCGYGTLTVPSRSQEAQNQTSRAYTADQIRLVQCLLAPAARLATVVMVESGCRVEDLATLCPAAERPLSNARLDQLRPDRFSGREAWPRFTFIGKGGHEYLSSVRPETARSLESIRLETPRDFIHRGLEHSTKQYYALPAGNPLSQQWTRASHHALGYSHGIHGLRHTFAQQRMDELTRSGITWSLALERTSQLMGHAGRKKC